MVCMLPEELGLGAVCDADSHIMPIKDWLAGYADPAYREIGPAVAAGLPAQPYADSGRWPSQGARAIAVRLVSSWTSPSYPR
jgi:hypothetical protein